MEGFEYDARQDLWLAEGFTGLDWADGSEAYLQRVFEQTASISDYPFELADFIQDWPSRYHLSHLRVNLLEAIRPLLGRSWDTLELGAGTGAITKWLAQAVANVDAFEGSVQRARANRGRTRDDKNVRVLVGDMVSTPFPREYDLITLIGVLEYTPSQPGIDRRQACLGLLHKIRSSLRGEGMLLLAIENRLGAKYWAGCGEDHSARLFDGLLDYPDDTPITFSRSELEELLCEAGFVNHQFYHLHPDYKLPTTVIREQDDPRCAGSVHQWMRSFAEDYSEHPRQYLMPDPLLLRSVERAGLLWHFSNSFLVLCSPHARTNLSEGWLAKRFSNVSRPELHHATTLVDREGALRIERRPIRSGCSFADLGDYQYSLSDGDFVAGSLLLFEAYEALVSQQWFERLTELCRDMLETARSCYGWVGPPDENGVDLLDGAAIDFTLWNIIRSPDGSLEFIDTKWRHKRPIPAEYVLFRSLYVLLSTAAPFVRNDFRTTIISLLRQFYPTFDDSRFDEHVKAERMFQEAATGREQSHCILDAEGRPLSPTVGSNLRDRLPHYEALESQLATMYESTSWRLTAPLRLIAQTVKRGSRLGRGVIGVVRGSRD